MMSRLTKNSAVWLIIGVPFASLLMGIVTLYFAFASADAGVNVEQAPMSKTSWQKKQ